jgi:hypothetical protein
VVGRAHGGGAECVCGAECKMGKKECLGRITIRC